MEEVSFELQSSPGVSFLSSPHADLSSIIAQQLLFSTFYAPRAPLGMKMLQGGLVIMGNMPVINWRLGKKSEKLFQSQVKITFVEYLLSDSTYMKP